ncbi:MAG: peptide transporter, partial [Thermosphaera sp.]
MKINKFIYRVYGLISLKPRLNTLLLISLLAFILTYGIYVRFVPYYTNGFEFFEYDSYIEYWQAKYVYENGILSWYTLTRENPATHIFWYP